MEELGLERDMMKVLESLKVVETGSSVTACLLGRYMGKTEDGRIKLKIDAKSVTAPRFDQLVI